MHYHLEIIIPPIKNVEKRIEEILAPFNEYEIMNKNSFWDEYVVGGRWAGEHILQSLDSEKMDAFYKKLKVEKITVSGLQVGKKTLEPADQQEKVDKIWNEFFPEIGGKCMLFDYYADKYARYAGYPDIVKVSELPKDFKASRVIIAVPAYVGRKLEAKTMSEDRIYNGVDWVDTKWSGLVADVIERHNKKYDRAEKESAMKRVVGEDWIAVTIDYHN
jgi:hypothetical protein